MNIARHITSVSIVCVCTWAVPCFAQSTDPVPAEQAQEQPHEAEMFTDPEDWYDLDAPTAPDYELDDIFAPHTAMFKVPIIDDPINFLLGKQENLEESIGLRVGFAYTQLYTQASGGPGSRWGMSGDADLLVDWTLVGRGTEDTGRLFFSAEDRFRFAAPVTPADLRFELGTLNGVGGPFNDRGLVVRDLFWDQRFLDARLRIVFGRGAPDDYFGSHRLQSVNFGFFNGNLAGNVTTTFPGHGPLAVISVHPTDYFYATVGGANAYSTTTQTSIDTLFDEGRIYGFGEVGFTPDIEGLGTGRYAISTWNMPSRELQDIPSDWGISLTAEQYLAENLWVYARFGYADQGLTGVKRAWQAALAIDGLLGSPDNVTGFGFGYSMPSDGSLDNETALEAFHRFQLTEHTQFSVGAQAIFDPSNDPDTDVLGVFSFRIRIVL